jgi:hypothetical protein
MAFLPSHATTPTQLANALADLDDGKIGPREVRVYFACFAVIRIASSSMCWRLSFAH